MTGEFEYNKPKNSYTLRKDSKGNLEALDWINECGACHATGMDTQKRQWSELNIGCEACHGPGGNHAANPTAVRMSVDKSSENCGRCHHIRGRDKTGLTGYPMDFEYGKPSTLMAKFNPIPMSDAASVFPDQTNSNRHRQQYLDWSKSAHTQWDVNCVTCHDPHTGSLTQRKADLRAQGDELCAKCHQDKTSNPVAHSMHSAQMANLDETQGRIEYSKQGWWQGADGSDQAGESRRWLHSGLKAGHTRWMTKGLLLARELYRPVATHLLDGGDGSSCAPSPSFSPPHPTRDTGPSGRDRRS